MKFELIFKEELNMKNGDILNIHVSYDEGELSLLDVVLADCQEGEIKFIKPECELVIHEDTTN